MKPRLLLAGRNRYSLPLAESLRRKFDALEQVFEVRVVGATVAGSPPRTMSLHSCRPSGRSR